MSRPAPVRRAFAPNSKQLLFLWFLWSKGGVAWLRELRPRLAGPERGRLVEKGLIVESKRAPAPGGGGGGGKRKAKRPRAWVELTVEGRACLGANLSEPVSRSASAGAVLREVLGGLERLLRERNMDFTDFDAAAFPPDPHADLSAEPRP